MVSIERQQEIGENGKLDAIDAYFTSTELLLDKNQNDPLLILWVKNDEKYPLLALPAQDILVIPASSTHNERIFSIAGYSTSEQTSRKQLGTWNTLKKQQVLL